MKPTVEDVQFNVAMRHANPDKPVRLRFHETMGKRISANRVLTLVRKLQAFADASERGSAADEYVNHAYGIGYYKGKAVAFRCAADELNNLLG